LSEWTGLHRGLGWFGSPGISGESYLDMMILIASPIPSVSSVSRWNGHGEAKRILGRGRGGDPHRSASSAVNSSLSPFRCRRLLVKAAGRAKQRGTGSASPCLSHPHGDRDCVAPCVGPAHWMRSYGGSMRDEGKTEGGHNCGVPARIRGGRKVSPR